MGPRWKRIGRGVGLGALLLSMVVSSQAQERSSRVYVVNPTGSVMAETSEAMAELMSAELIRADIQAFTYRNLADQLREEERKEILKCDEGSKCVEELVSSFGFARRLFAHVSKQPSGQWLVVLTLMDKSEVKNKVVETVKCSESDLPGVAAAVALKVVREEGGQSEPHRGTGEPEGIPRPIGLPDEPGANTLDSRGQSPGAPTHMQGPVPALPLGFFFHAGAAWRSIQPAFENSHLLYGNGPDMPAGGFELAGGYSLGRFFYLSLDTALMFTTAHSNFYESIEDQNGVVLMKMPSAVAWSLAGGPGALLSLGAAELHIGVAAQLDGVVAEQATRLSDGSKARVRPLPLDVSARLDAGVRYRVWRGFGIYLRGLWAVPREGFDWGVAGGIRMDL